MADKTKQHFLAIDLGAESGRGMLGLFDGARLTLTEQGRFPTGQGDADIAPDGRRRWHFERIWEEIDGIVRKTETEHEGRIDGVGVDSWGVDFGLLDASGNLLQVPVQYRDPSHGEAQAKVQSTIGPEELWKESGIQPLPFNTIFQLVARQATDPGLLDRARHLLFMPDLVHHRLTQGQSVTSGVEVTNASTSAMLKADRSGWNSPLLDRLGLPQQFLGPIHQSGSLLGRTPAGTPVYAPCTHDTASAVLSVPVEAGASWAFLSSGTWSLLGEELTSPVLSVDALNARFSNEAGIAGTTRFLKNIMGLWLVQECRRSLNRDSGRDYTYAEITTLAAEAEPLRSVVDATADRFFAPADMPAAIRAACAEAGHPEPDSVARLIRCCLDSLALAYRIALRNLEAMTSRSIDTLYIVGGGSQNRLLNQLTADACGIRVVAGPSEATAVGNILAQMIGAGLLADRAEARELCRASFAPEIYTPRTETSAAWETCEGEFSTRQ